MCFINDEAPEFYAQKVYKARKEHKCYECREIIPIGIKYLKTSGVWGGEFSSFKTCRRCEYMRQAIHDKEVASGCASYESWCAFGEIQEVLKDYGFEGFVPLYSVPLTYKMPGEIRQ